MTQQDMNPTLHSGNEISMTEREIGHQSCLSQIPDSEPRIHPGVNNNSTSPCPEATDIEEVYACSSDTKHHSRRLALTESRWGYTWQRLVINLLILGLFVVVVIFVRATYGAERNSAQKTTLNSLMKLEPSTTLAVLRVSQGVLSTLTSLSLVDSLVALQWSIIESRQGLHYLDLLALSPTSGFTGALSLIFSSVAKGSSKAYALLRLSLVSIVWVSGVVLFFDTSLTTVYDTASTYNATAGVGLFNHSLVQPFMDALHSSAPGYPYEVLPYTYYAAVYTLVLNPLVTTVSKPILCETGSCMSYLLSGGLEYVAPWAPQGNDSHDSVKIDKVPSLQMDFETPSNSIFTDSDCETFGQFGFTIGIRLCLEKAPNPHELIRAGLFVCLNGTDGDSCGGNEERPNITTTLSVYTRYATIVAARSNYSIVDVTDISSPILPPEFDIDSYRVAMSWLLNYSAAAIPAPSSIAQTFWSSPEQLRDPSTYGILLQNFQSILAFPFWLFNNNNWGNIELLSNQITPFLPPQFYTQASVVAPFPKIEFNPAMFSLFLVLQGLAMVFNWSVLLWLWFGPKIATSMSVWTLFDVAYKTRVQGVDDAQYESLNTSDIVCVMKDAQVHKRKR